MHKRQTFKVGLVPILDLFICNTTFLLEWIHHNYFLPHPSEFNSHNHPLGLWDNDDHHYHLVPLFFFLSLIIIIVIVVVIVIIMLSHPRRLQLLILHYIMKLYQQKRLCSIKWYTIVKLMMKCCAVKVCKYKDLCPIFIRYYLDITLAFA